MTDPKQVEAIYHSVIDDTISKLAPEFENAGVPLQILARLQELWMASLANAMRPAVPDTATHSQSIPSASLRAASSPISSTSASKGTKATAASSSQTTSAAHSATDSNATQIAVTGSGAGDAAANDADLLRYTISEPTAASEVKQGTEPTTETSSAPITATNGTTETSAPSIEQNKTIAENQAAPSIAADEEEPESSDVSDDDEVDTSSWTNTLMSLYEEPTKRTKNKRTYKLVKGILNVGGRDYLFKSGKAEFEWR